MGKNYLGDDWWDDRPAATADHSGALARTQVDTLEAPAHQHRREDTSRNTNFAKATGTERAPDGVPVPYRTQAPYQAPTTDQAPTTYRAPVDWEHNSTSHNPAWNQRVPMPGQPVRSTIPGISAGKMIGFMSAGFGLVFLIVLLVVLGGGTGSHNGFASGSGAGVAPGLSWEERRALEEEFTVENGVPLTEGSLTNYELDALVIPAIRHISSDSTPLDIANLIGTEPQRAWYWPEQGTIRLSWVSTESFEYSTSFEVSFNLDAEITEFDFRTENTVDEAFTTAWQTLPLANGMDIATAIEIVGEPPSSLSFRFVQNPTFTNLAPGGMMRWAPAEGHAFHSLRLSSEGNLQLTGGF